MESPGSWDLLTSSLAISDLTQPLNVWAFLVVQGLVSDSGPQRDAFLNIVRHEQQLDITGPSLPARVAHELFGTKIANPIGQGADPWATCAAERLETIALGGPPAVGHEDLELIREWRTYAAREQCREG